MRTRQVKPGFFKNEDLAACTSNARLMFIGLWCLADREGRLEDRPARIRAEVFPYEHHDADALLAELKARGFITRYAVNGRKLIQVNKFRDNQRVHPNEAPSELPAPMDNQGVADDAPTTHQGDTSDAPTTNQIALVSVPSCTSEPSRRDVSASEGGGCRGEGDGRPAPGSDFEPLRVYPAGGTPEPAAPQGFDAFWEAYPKKVGKKDAVKAWKKGRIGKQLAERIVEAVERQKGWRRWREGFIPNPATWLNQGRWDDEEEPEPQRPGQNNKTRLERLREELGE